MTVMSISELECRELPGRSSFARRGCSSDGQPYVVPIYVAFENDSLYVVSTVGQKIEWMRSNPRVCVQVDEIHSSQQWVSAVATGWYQELSEPQYSDERAHAPAGVGQEP